MPVVHYQSGEKRGYHCYRRMPQRPGTDGCGVYRGISAGINGYIWKMKGSRKTDSVFLLPFEYIIENRILRSFKNAVMIIKIVVSTDAFQTNKNI